MVIKINDELIKLKNIIITDFCDGDENNCTSDNIKDYLEKNSAESNNVLLRNFIETSSNIRKYIENINSDVEDVDDVMRNEQHDHKQNVKNQIFSIIIFALIIELFILFFISYILFDFSKGSSANAFTGIFNKLSIVLILLYIGYMIFVYTVKKIKDLKNELNIYLQGLTSELNVIIQNLQMLSSNLKVNNDNIDITNIDNLSENLVVLIQNINKSIISFNKKLNRVHIFDQIKDINVIFNNFQELLYKKYNKFTDITDNNDKVITCLMSLILNKEEKTDNNEYNCYLGNTMMDLYVNNKKEGFNNGFENIESIDVDEFYNSLTKDVIDKSNQNMLKDMKMYNIISNIFVNKVYEYKIRKQDFIIYIYKHFENIDLKNYPDIEISKFDLINNFKVFINFVYIEVANKDKISIYDNVSHPSNVSRNKFYQIIDIYKYKDLENLSNKLEETRNKIKIFYEDHKDFIHKNLETHEDSNKHLLYFFILILVVSFLQLFNFIRANLGTRTYKNYLNIIRNFSILLTINIIIFSYWYKSTVKTQYEKNLLETNNNKLLKKLDELHKSIVLTLDYKQNNLSEIYTKFKIKNSINNFDNEIYYIELDNEELLILEKDDIKHLVYNDFYNKLTEVLKIYECCTFLKDHEKIPVFPWTDFSINVIFMSIILVIIFNIISNNDDINPFKIVKEIRNRLLITDKNTQDRLRKMVQSGGVSDGVPEDISQAIANDFTENNVVVPDNAQPQSQSLRDLSFSDNLFTSLNIVNISVIYICILYSYKIYSSTFSYYQNLYR